MPSTHILTVNSRTFDIHLRYMFAGTGKDGAEHQGGALADILGIREGDNIVFYVAEHGFYGFFTAMSVDGGNLVFYESPNGQYLDTELGKKTLTYRFFIRPSNHGVFRRGVSEWDAIENPDHILEQSIFNMQWGWIFKKLKGGRGCVAIPEEESQLLRAIITGGNERLERADQYCFSQGEIGPCAEPHEYRGDTRRVPAIHEDLRRIYTEEDLRIFFTANAGREYILDTVLRPRDYGQIVYIANEAKCSFGMRSIDLLFLTNGNTCLLVELKNDFECGISILGQLSGYARWIGSYKRGLERIVPILILREPRVCPARRGGLRFKHLSEEDFRNGQLSPWYTEIVGKLDETRTGLGAVAIPRVEELERFVFRTNSQNELESFSAI